MFQIQEGKKLMDDVPIQLRRRQSHSVDTSATIEALEEISEDS
jgi:hypothetical protein